MRMKQNTRGRGTALVERNLSDLTIFLEVRGKPGYDKIEKWIKTTGNRSNNRSDQKKRLYFPSETARTANSQTANS
jgi:hypothetical protein